MWLALALFFAWFPSEAFAHPGQSWGDPLAELDASLAPQQLSTRALLAMELPRLIVSTNPRVRHTIMDNPFMHALFKGVRMPGLSTARASVRVPDPRIMMLALRPHGAGGVLRLRVRFDVGLFDNTGPLRRFLSLRRSDV